MKKSVFLILIPVLLGSCMSLGDAFSQLTFSTGSTETRQVDSESPSGGEADEGAVIEQEDSQKDQDERTAMDMSMFLGPELQFSLLYSSYYMLGGYGFGEDNFRDGEGVRWLIRTEGKGDEIHMTRARLKTLSDKSVWWSFRAETGEDEFYYEMLIEDTYHVSKVRYLNMSTGQIDQFTIEKSEDEEDYETLERSELERYSVGSEQIRTKAGSFKANHLLIEDPEGNYRYDYWIADRAPGYSVKYRFENREDNQILTGELVDIRGGYRTELGSY